MQPTATMATAPASAAVALTTSWDNATSRPTAEPDPGPDSHVVLVVVVSLFAGGALVVLSGALLLCKRCWEARRSDRATEEAEKAITTYLDNSTQPAPDPDRAGADPEGRDAETERFLSTGSTGRRVSFNEAALFEQGHKAQDKGRRYTLTEGDFHHLKNARLTHLHLPPLKIVTIHECDPGEGSAAATSKASLAIFQPPGKALTGRSLGPSSALPGDPYNSTASAADFAECSASASSSSVEGASPGRRQPLLQGQEVEAGAQPARVQPGHERLPKAAPLPAAAGGQREHGAGRRCCPGGLYPVHRPRRRGQGLPTAQPLPGQPQQPAPRSRLEAAGEPGAVGGASPERSPERAGPEQQQQQQQQQEVDAEREAAADPAQTTYRDIWSLRASLELHAATASDHSSSGNDRDSVRSGDSSGSGGAPPAFPPPSPPPAPRQRSKDGGDAGEAGGPRKLLQMDSGYASIEGRGAGDEGPPSAAEKRLSFGSAATAEGSFEAPAAQTEAPAAPARPRSPRAWPRRAPRRDYSIDEKTDALFHEFLRHDPQFDETPPAAARHRARAHPHAHARKQWQQRGRQHSDPGARAAQAPPPLGAEPRPARAPLRRGDSVDGPPDGRVPAVGAADADAIPVIEEEPGGGGGCPASGLCVEPSGALLGKLAAGLDDRLFLPRLDEPAVPALAAAAPTSPDRSPA
ncbi:voltage-dependent calcium channel beta subunit-associated regulatory protein isoform X2 [Choloepus didactylus]|uniref:voltage-dependent calcium channel beta subunit-associated regulatory protein isoform X2 n=1 Tax=Choloepus didactylus TaxID=27675 RepID=UPI0018A07813|nr:voltage-dependent calcium channel beta subunit-associated regulatory protein isoform X2 [Choloepus didactylus]